MREKIKSWGDAARRTSVRSAVLLGALLVLGVGVAGAVPVGQITEFSVGLNAGAILEGLTPGPDGNLWFADRGTTKALGQISPEGVIAEFSSGLRAAFRAG